jgi:hypothetical protein
MCLNFIQGGGCSVTRGRCQLAQAGSSARNEDGCCELHGQFDVWVNQDNAVLISDMGFPSDEPKQCLALGINRTLAEQVAEKKACELGTRIETTKHICIRCGRQFWTSRHDLTSGFAETGQSHLCPNCIHEKNEGIRRKLGDLQYWCG